MVDGGRSHGLDPDVDRQWGLEAAAVAAAVDLDLRGNADTGPAGGLRDEGVLLDAVQQDAEGDAATQHAVSLCTSTTANVHVDHRERGVGVGQGPGRGGERGGHGVTSVSGWVKFPGVAAGRAGDSSHG
ncbi:hypothetical protein [Streptomyces sp. OE57]|uniref:hypothetical protein n=1 Tax=Streptomyces lacaronensis TaxID=3379885 RepID=UPI0039B730F1